EEVLVVNKCDLSADSGIGAEARISCATGEGIEALVERIADRVRHGQPIGDSLAAINARHQACLARAAEALDAAIERFDAATAPEFVAVDLRASLDAVGEVVGVVDADDILGRIFGSFCIGK
ncbi:MAG TPA: tRNA uridine-5-carboxymethylaminomethyl(34) synthesis GTPase MnmE, partial [Chthoniobacterales bacterium]|nr:tRNA uridine-5-carboxymethylaminomethyl(34) synthesis GTPase MnmE [Chthoniobacterales bacterium]